MIRSSRGVVAALVVIGAGCSSPSGQAPHQGIDPCTALASAQCSQMQTCTPNLLIEVYGTESTCVTREYLACTDELAATQTGFSATAATACSQAITAQSCSDVLQGLTPAACQPTPGQRAMGAACVFSSQCQSGFCAVVTNTACGKCAPAPTVGASCATTGCGPSLACAAGDSTCEEPGTSGDGCGPNHPCQANLYCQISAGNTSGGCNALATKQGAMCDPTGATLPLCDDRLGLACLGSPPTCQPVTNTMDEDVCGDLDGGFVDCTAGVCILSGGDQGTCDGSADDDGTCNTMTGPGCMPPALCVTSNGMGGSGVCLDPIDSLCH